MKYVYAHSINGVVFYIGCGTKIRTKDTRSRNELWKNKVKSNNGVFELSIISKHRTRWAGWRAELFAIARFKPECNVYNKRETACNRDIRAELKEEQLVKRYIPLTDYRRAQQERQLIVLK